MANEVDSDDSRINAGAFSAADPPRKVPIDRFPDYLATFLDFAKWGFKVTYISPDRKTLIYDSPSSRLKSSLRIEREADEISVKHGRKHAPNEGHIIEWEGEKCVAWHNIRYLHVPEFMDGLTARDVFERTLAQVESPAMTEFMKTQLGPRLPYPASGLAYDQFLWERYGTKLFDLFDIRRADLWEDFQRFVSDYYALRMAASERFAASQHLFEVPDWCIC